MNKLSQHKDYIIQQFTNGTTAQKIALELNCACGSVCRRLREWIPDLPSNRTLKYDVDINFFKEINTEQKAYTLGLFYSDGCVAKNSIRLSMCDEDVILKVKSYIQYTGPITIFKRPHMTQTGYILEIGRQELVKSLINKGCPIKKSLILKFPTEDIVPINMLHHFVRGYADGDGSIYRYKKKKCWKASLIGTKEMMEGILSINGIRGRLLKAKTKSNGNTWTIHFERKQDVFDYLTYIYKDATCYMDRKHAKAMQCLKEFYI